MRDRLPAVPAARLRERADVTVEERGRRYAARLPVTLGRPTGTPARGGCSTAPRRRCAASAACASLERLTSGPGTLATTEYRLRAPDRLAWRTGRDVRSVVIGERQWMKTPGTPWREGEYGSGLAFRTRSWFAWRRYARTVRLLDERTDRGRRLVDVALMDEGTPVWFRLDVDARTGRVLAERMIARSRFGRTRFSDFGRRFAIERPREAP